MPDAVGAGRGQALWLAAGGVALIALLAGPPRAFAASIEPAGQGADMVILSACHDTRTDGDLFSKSPVAFRAGSAVSATFSYRVIGYALPDGPASPGIIVTRGGPDSVARLWDAQTGSPLMALRGHTNRVTSARFSADGARIITASEDGDARVWDARTGQQVGWLKGSSGPLFRAMFDPGGTRAVTSGADGIARLWDVASGRLLQSFEGHRDQITSFAFSADGRSLLTGSVDGTARRWRVADGRQQTVFSGVWYPVTAVAFSADGKLVATGYPRSAEARVWDADTGGLLGVLPETGDVNALAFSPDGTQLAVAAGAKPIQVFDLASRTRAASLEGHLMTPFALAFGAGGKTVISGSLDETVRIWDVQTSQSLGVFDGPRHWVRAVAASRDLTKIATAGSKRYPMPWNESAFLWTHLGNPPVPLLKDGGKLEKMAFSPDGSLLAWSGERAVQIRSTITGRTVFTTALHPPSTSVFAFNSDGTKLAVIQWGSASVLDTRSWHLSTDLSHSHLTKYGRPLLPAEPLAFSSDGQFLVTGSTSYDALLWRLESGEAVAALSGSRGPVLSASFNPNGGEAVTGSGDGVARMWSVPGGRLTRALGGDGGAVAPGSMSDNQRITTALYSPDGRQVITLSDAGAVLVWSEAETWSPRPIIWDSSHFFVGGVGWSDAGRPFLAGCRAAAVH